jgi:hypothetical protein
LGQRALDTISAGALLGFEGVHLAFGAAEVAPGQGVGERGQGARAGGRRLALELGQRRFSVTHRAFEGRVAALADVGPGGGDAGLRGLELTAVHLGQGEVQPRAGGHGGIRAASGLLQPLHALGLGARLHEDQAQEPRRRVAGDAVQRLRRQTQLTGLVERHGLKHPGLRPRAAVGEGVVEPRGLDEPPRREGLGGLFEERLPVGVEAQALGGGRDDGAFSGEAQAQEAPEEDQAHSPALAVTSRANPAKS